MRKPSSSWYKPTSTSELLQERFFSKVNKTDTCWEWIGSKDTIGYGCMTVQKVGKRAHRVSYEMHKGTIPEGLVVMHSCDNRGCVNPDHLSVGTMMDNVRDMMNKGRFVSGQANKTHCKRGHEFTPDNIYYHTNNSRQCRVCIKARGQTPEAKAKHQARKKVARAKKKEEYQQLLHHLLHPCQ